MRPLDRVVLPSASGVPLNARGVVIARQENDNEPVPDESSSRAVTDRTHPIPFNHDRRVILTRVLRNHIPLLRSHLALALCDNVRDGAFRVRRAPLPRDLVALTQC